MATSKSDGDSGIMSPAEIVTYLNSLGYWDAFDGAGVTILETGEKFAKSRLKVRDAARRLGGTISGPAQFTAADVTIFFAILATLGPQAGAVTAQISINFLLQPRGEALITEAHLLKIGRSLVVAEAKIYVEGEPNLVATATGSFSLMPQKEGPQKGGPQKGGHQKEGPQKGG